MHYLGHRARLRERFEKSPSALADYELLEMLLCIILPRKDVKPIAKDLLRQFGSIQQLICADLTQLINCPGIGKTTALAVKLVHQIFQRVLQDELKSKKLLSDYDRLIEYLKIAMAYKSIEQFRVLFLDKNYQLIRDQELQQGTVDYVSLYIREVIKICLDLHATSIILVHNHPSGDTTPSRADLLTTRTLLVAAKQVEIELLDHIIIGKHGFYSFRREGLFDVQKT